MHWPLDGGTPFEVQAGLFDADVIGKRQQLQAEDLLQQGRIKVNALFDRRGRHKSVHVGLADGHCEGHINRVRIAFNAEYRDLVLGAGDRQGQSLFERPQKWIHKVVFRDIGHPHLRVMDLQNGVNYSVQ